MLERIKAFIDYKKLSVRKFEQALGMSNGTIHNAVVKGSSISSQWLTKMVQEFPELNPVWLVTGNGSMLNTEDTLDQASTKAPYFDVDFSGGFNEFYNDQTQTPAEYVECKSLKGVEYWCNLKGHSMEPTIADGERIALQELPTSGALPTFGGIYAIVTSSGLRTVKRIEKSRKKGFLLLKADNKEFDSQEVEISTITHLFKVVAHLGIFPQ
ncbi:MAG: hypothetical protein K6G31_12640 [Paludibacteraceae bacterium]|nr:hypothetical protein [Paludibacteraceae bacterium]